MLIKKILTAILLLFVAICFAAIVFNHWRENREYIARSAEKNVEKNAEKPTVSEKVVLYYFHTHRRCDSCLNVEAFCKDAMDWGFAKQLAAGTLEYRIVDIDDPADRHFDQDFGLGGSPTIVLVKEENGKNLVAVLLEDAWKNVTTEKKSEFIAKIQKETREFWDEYGPGKNITAQLASTAAAPASPEPKSADSKPEAESFLEKPPQSYAWGLLWALGLGVFTAITPCTLVANVAAVSYIGRRVDSPRQILLAGSFYSGGQTLAYAVLGFIVVAGLLASTAVSSFLHRYMNELLGPILILTAMVLFGLFDITFSGPGIGERLQKRVDTWGIWGAFLLGVIFAVTFCPLSGALFFFQLIPASVQLESRLLMPALYGLGNVLPILAITLLLAFGARSFSKTYHRITQLERVLRYLVAALFLAAGVIYSMLYIFDVLR
jgi:cytochrome c biogenesis protein CcdA